MRIEPLGDSAALLSSLTEPACRLVPLLEKLPGVAEAVASYDTVGVYFEPGADALRDLEAWLREAGLAAGREPLPKNDSFGQGENVRKSHTVPACYEMGEDLGEVARALFLSTEDVIAAHLSIEYTCCAIGFQPGFPYLGYLPDSISGLPRRPEPRVLVRQGSIGVTARQTGIYPSDCSGGWNLIARTPLIIVDVEDAYFPIEAGDRIRFVRIDSREFKELKGERL